MEKTCSNRQFDQFNIIVSTVSEPGTVPQAVLKSASNKIYQKYNFFEMTLQIENFTVKMEDCAQCQVPH